MRMGTKSLLYGAHQFLIHPFFVMLAWLRLYGFPGPGILLAIFVHDWGYWGVPSIEGEEGDRHPEWAANLFQKLGWSGLEGECRFHSRFWANRMGKEPSRLCWADKLGVALYPAWLWVFLSKLTGEIHEYMQNPKYEIHLGIEVADTPTQFFVRYKTKVKQWRLNDWKSALPQNKET
jgi:hypothetical protein